MHRLDMFIVNLRSMIIMPASCAAVISLGLSCPLVGTRSWNQQMELRFIEKDEHCDHTKYIERTMRDNADDNIALPPYDIHKRQKS